MEIAANGRYPLVPITALHEVVDGYALPWSLHLTHSHMWPGAGGLAIADVIIVDLGIRREG